MLPASRHHLADLIDESPIIFMNQASQSVPSGQKFELNAEMLTNLFEAYRQILLALTSKNRSHDLNGMLEPTLAEELQDYLLADLDKNECQL